MEFLPAAFDSLKLYNQFIVYVLVPSKTRKGKTDKFPIDYRSQQIANAHDSSIWLDADSAIAWAKHYGENYGVGFVFTANDPFWFLDIDNCLEPCGTKWSELATSLCTTFAGAAIEISASGRGLHIIATGEVPEHKCRNGEYNLEFYTDGRFVALTGNGASGNAGLDYTQYMPWLVQAYFMPSESKGDGSEYDYDKACPGWNGPSDDETLLERALRSSPKGSVFNQQDQKKAKFSDLWERNIVMLAQTYPDPNRECGYDESSADAALAQHLAFWTGNNTERMRRLMLRSALKRDKWDREDYLPRTIATACGRQTDWLNDKPPQDTSTGDGNQVRPVRKEGNTFLSIDEQIELFTGCVYVTDEHRALIPGGYLINGERFRVMYGGNSFPMDTKNEKVSRNAWECFTESQAIIAPRATSSCFKPTLPPGQIIYQENQTLVNCWWPIETVQIQGDVTLFLDLLKLMIPDETDRMILISYLAAIVQHKGIKFQWCPVIQGVEGNGKTLLTRCVAFAIGHRYTHFPKAAELDSKFNDWLYAKLFIGVEDIYVPDGRLQIMEAMKPMVTSERQEIEPKGGTKVTRDICANFLINTNHKDGLRKTNNDRRFAPFYTAQQSVYDLKRDGMDGNFFPRIYSWLENGGYANMAYFLSTFQIPDEYNPATLCRRAPRTTSTDNAIEEGRGSIEQEIMECTIQNTPGFKNGWISSMAVDKLLNHLNAAHKIPLKRRRQLLQNLGYDHHPNLRDGRVNNIVMPDGGKPRLYIKTGHRDATIDGAVNIERAYEDAQR